MLEKRLKTLFDFQRFEHSSALQSVINETLERYPGNVVTLPDESLSMAAGGVTAEEKKQSKVIRDDNGIL